MFGLTAALLFAFAAASHPHHAAAYELIVPFSGTQGASQSVTGIGQYIKTIYTFGIGFGALLAMVMIVIGAVEYTVSEAIPSKEDAKDRILQAVLGLILLIASVFIVSLINPELPELKEPTAESVAPLPPPPPPPPGFVPAPTNLKSQKQDTGQEILTWNYTPNPANPGPVEFFVEYKIFSEPNAQWKGLASGISGTNSAIPYELYTTPSIITLFQVKAFQEGKFSDPSNEISLAGPLLSEPELSVSPTANVLILGWSYNQAEGETVSGFSLYYAGGSKVAGKVAFSSWVLLGGKMPPDKYAVTVDPAAYGMPTCGGCLKFKVLVHITDAKGNSYNASSQEKITSTP